jgi:hypothetical protein
MLIGVGALPAFAPTPSRIAASIEVAVVPSLNDIARKAGSYAESYHRDFTSVVAEEHYVQRVKRSAGGAGAAGVTTAEQRTLRSDFMLLRGEPGETAWLSFRDIFEVDGSAVTGERGRLELWLRGSRASFASRARALAFDQARYNIGDVVRTINVPLLPLEFLVPANQDRLRFRMRGRDTLLATEVAVVTFEERRKPTLIRTPDGGDVPANGTFWIEPATGRVLKTELKTGEKDRRQIRTSIVVSYERNDRLDMLVPSVMEETYLTARETITGIARYSNYRRFETEVRIKQRPY